MDLKLIKTLNDFFGQQKISFTTRMSIYGVYVIMMTVFVLACVNYILNTQALTEISNGVVITTTASQRLTASLRAWQWVLVIYARVVGVRKTSNIRAIIKGYCLTESLNMQNLNSQLKTNLDELGSQTIVDIIFSTRLSFWDPVLGTMITKGPIDTFTANAILSMADLVVATWGGTDADLLTRSEPLQTINNTANGYLLSSETQIIEILGGLDDIITNNENSLKSILVGENIALMILCASLLLVARVVLRMYSRTFQAFVRLSPNSVEDRVYRIKKFQTSLDDNIEAKSFVKNLNLYFSFFEEHSQNKFAKTNKKDNKTRTRIFGRSFTNRGLVIYIAKYLLLAFAFILIISGLFEVLFFESISSFGKLSDINTQLSISNKLGYQSCLVLSSFYFNAIFINKTNYLIREEAPAIQVEKNLESFGNVNQQLLSALFSSSNDFDPILQDFMQKDVCSYISSDSVNTSTCVTSTQDGTLGLLGLNLKYYTTSSNYWMLYQQDHSYQTAMDLVTSYFSDVTLDIAVLDAAYTFLTGYITDNFNNEENKLKKVNLLLSLAAMLFIVLSTLVIQRTTVKILAVLDNSQKKLFRVLTFNVFNQNKSVAFILKKEFGNEVEGLNRLLGS